MLKRTLLAAALAVATTTAVADPVTYALDPAHTNVVASWNHLGFSNPILHFGNVDGTVVYDADDVGASSVRVTIPVDGLEGFTPAFNEHLLSDELFDAAQYPEITFTSTSVEAAGEGKLKVTGDLTIRGITSEVVLDTTLNGAADHPMMPGRQAIGFDATATVKRTDFGIGYAVPAVSDEIELRITTEGLAPEA